MIIIIIIIIIMIIIIIKYRNNLRTSTTVLLRYVSRSSKKDGIVRKIKTGPLRSERTLDPFRTAVPFWGQTTRNSSSFPPKRDCGSKGVIGEQKLLSFVTQLSNMIDPSEST